MTSSVEQTYRRAEPTVMQAVMAGTMLGMAEPLLPTGQPLVNVKMWYQTTVRQGSTKQPLAVPFPATPRALYAGAFANMAGLGPVTAAQMATVAAVRPLFSFMGVDGQSQDVAAGATGGFVAALVATPFEAVMVRMGQEVARRVKTRAPLPTYSAVLHAMYREKGAQGFMTGYVGTAGRDGIFVAAYKAGAPAMKKMFLGYTDNETVASVGGAVFAGIVASLASQHLDTWKTRLQAGDPTSVRSILREGTRGSLPRLARVVAGVTFFSLGESTLVHLFNRMSLGT